MIRMTTTTNDKNENNKQDNNNRSRRHEPWFPHWRWRQSLVKLVSHKYESLAMTHFGDWYPYRVRSKLCGLWPTEFVWLLTNQNSAIRLIDKSSYLGWKRGGNHNFELWNRELHKMTEKLFETNFTDDYREEFLYWPQKKFYPACLKMITSSFPYHKNNRTSKWPKILSLE